MRAFFLMRHFVPRMLRSALPLRRGALLIRAPSDHRRFLGPGSAEQREERCTASGTRCAASVRMTAVRAVPMYRFH